MRWWLVGCVLSACSVAHGLCHGIPGTRPRSALELSEQAVGDEPESTKEGVSPNSLRNGPDGVTVGTLGPSHHRSVVSTTYMPDGAGPHTISWRALRYGPLGR